MQKTVIACCVGALFAAGTAVAATHTLGDKVGIAGEGSALTVNTQTQKVTDKSQLMGVSGFLCLGRLFQGQPNEAALCI